MNYRQMDESRLPEWEEKDQAAAPVPGIANPLQFPELDGLTELLERETELLRAGDFDAFMRLQPAKRAGLRAAERAGRRVSGTPSDLAALEGAMSRLGSAAERNERLLLAMKEATASIRAHAMEALEAGQTDGLYTRGGEARSQKRLSTKGVHVKL